jgi:hypothetical protein
MARWSVKNKFARRGEPVTYDPRGRRYLVGEAEHRRARETPLDERPFHGGRHVWSASPNVESLVYEREAGYR